MPAFAPTSMMDTPVPALLARGYGDMGLQAPPVRGLAATALPPAVAALLDQDGGMTQALARHWQAPVSLTVLHRIVDAECLRRVIVLNTRERPVAFGMIEIDLPALPAAVRAAVLAESAPFGTLLRAGGLPFTSRPEHFFTLAADALLAAHLNSPPGTALYGRETRLAAAITDTAGHESWTPLARVLEILAPLPGSADKPADKRA